jgi:eukaryotic-like serine/threonine-protein kinase
MPGPTSAEPVLVADRYEVNPKQPLPGAGGGPPAFAARDRTGAHAPVMAVQVQRRFPARGLMQGGFGGLVEGVLAPLGLGCGPGGDGSEAFYAIAQAPPGPAVMAVNRAWSETELLDQVLRPAARALDRLSRKGITHRAIRPDNVFMAPGGAVLGFAWGAPPAMHQPAVFEAPYSAMCLPAGRGEGSVADDVYSLGVLLLSLAMGHAPMAGMSEEEIIRRKLMMGNFEALTERQRLPPVLSDVVRGMLAEDPEHRPSPALLTEPWSARMRRVAARPQRHAARPLQLAGHVVRDPRTLAYAVARSPEEAFRALRAGVADEWLRRVLGEPALAARLDKALELRVLDPEGARGDAMAATRVVAAIDPLMPLCWRGLAIWPDGLGAALAAAEDSAVVERLTELVATEAIAAWAIMRAERCDAAHLRSQARQYRAWLKTAGPSGGIQRLVYMLNPLLPCGSPMVGNAWVWRVGDLLPALEKRGAGDRPKQLPIDREIAAFIVSRPERRGEDESVALGQVTADSCLGVLGRLQARSNVGALPALAAWIAETPGLISWRSKARRDRAVARVKELAASGQLLPMLAMVRDKAEDDADRHGALAAQQELARIDSMLADAKGAAQARAAAAVRWGYEIATAVGLLGLALSLAMAAIR